MKKLFKKVLVYLSVIAIVVQSLSPVAYLQLNSGAYAQTVDETTASPTPESNSADATTTVDQTTPPADTQTPTPESNSADATPTPVPTDTPTETLTPTPTPESNSADATPVDNLSPPIDNSQTSTDTSAQVQGESITPTPASNAADAILTTENPKDEQLNIIVLDNVSAPTVNLDAVVSEGSAVLTTDKPDYAPTDTALITGSNLLPNTTYSLRIWSDDEPATSTTVDVTSDENGIFAYAYQLDGTYRPNYSAELKDSAGNVVATTTFTDSVPFSSQTVTGACMADQPNQNGLVCTANDISIASVTGITILDDGCQYPGDTVNFTANWQVQSGAQSRYNVGLWFATGGQTSALNGTCSISTLPSGGTPFFEEKPTTDTCGDIDNSSTGTVSITMTATCNPDPTTALLKLPYCTSWQQNKNEDGTCTSPTGTLPGTGSKCNCQNGFTVPITIPPAIEVIKNLVPSNDSGKFDLQVNLVTKKSDAINGDTTGKVGITTGSNTFGEVRGTSTTLSDYSATASCVLRGTQTSVSTSQNGNTWTIANVTNGQDIICTITNTRVNNGSINIVKVGENNNSQDFGFNTTGGLIPDETSSPDFSLDDDLNATLSNTKTFTGVAAGTYTVSEIATAGWTLGSIVCTDPTQNSQGALPTAPTATINLAAGETVTCTFTNTLNKGNIKVNKMVDTNGDGDYADTGEGLNGTASNAFTWTYRGIGPNVMGTTQSGLTSGSGSLSENTVTNYNLVGWYRNSGQGSCANPDSTTLPASIDILTDQTVEITICNAINTGTVVVHKDVQGPNGEDVTDNSNSFEASLDGGTGQLISDNISHTYLDVPVGSHTITESLVDTDYTLYGISSVAGGSGNTSGLTITVTTGTNNVYVTNRQKTGTITVVKDVVDPSGGPISDTHSFTVNLTPGSQTSPLAEGSNAVFTVNPGTYTASENDDANYDELGCLTATGKTDIVVGSGGSATITCTNKQNPGTISGTKFDENENVLSGWTINLFSCTALGIGCGTLPIATFTTLTNGTYSFSNLVTGFYRVVEVLQDGWTNISDLFHDVQIQPGTESTQNDFVNQGDLSITACKYEDSNGTQDGGNFTPVSNWNFTLGQATQNTGDDNCTTFQNLTPGTYEVSELPVREGWYVADDSQGSRRAVLTNENITVNFYNYQKGEISGTKWNDIDSNGEWNDEPTLSDWHIQLFEDNDGVKGAQVGADQITDADGNYSFANVDPGDYFVCEDLQDGWIQTYPDFDQEYSNCHAVTVTSGQEYGSKDFGNFRLGQIYGFKYEDTNGDGNFDEGEPKLNDWEICLDNENWEDKECINTYNSEDYGDGYFEFTGLEYGDYILTEDETNTDYQRTQPESDSYNILIESGSGFGEGDVRYFGNAPLTDIGGYKWNDENPNGRKDCILNEETENTECEDILGGWTIFLDDNGNGQLDEEEEQTTTENNIRSDNFGRYSFFDLLPGDYSICEVQQDGWTQTYPFSYLYDEEADEEKPTYCHNITIPNANEEYNFGNQNLLPKLTIAKTNDAVGDKSPGDTVGFTITISANKEGGPADNVQVVDLLPKGFVFNPSSWKVVSSDTTRGVSGDITSLLTAPTYASPGTWSLGHMNSGETLTLSYTATIDGSQQTGTYYDNAWGVGNPVGNPLTQVFAKAFGDGDLDIPDPDSLFVGTQVSIVNPNQPGVDYKATSTQEVLGASTYLPATGENTLWVIIATLLSGLGLGSLFLGFKLRRKYEKN